MRTVSRGWVVVLCSAAIALACCGDESQESAEHGGAAAAAGAKSPSTPALVDDDGTSILPSPNYISTSRPECGFEPQLTQVDLTTSKDVPVEGAGATLGLGDSGADITILPCMLDRTVSFNAQRYVVLTPGLIALAKAGELDSLTVPPGVDLASLRLFPDGFTPKAGSTVSATPEANLRGTLIWVWASAPKDATVWQFRDGAWAQLPAHMRERRGDGDATQPVLAASVTLSTNMTVVLAF